MKGLTLLLCLTLLSACELKKEGETIQIVFSAEIKESDSFGKYRIELTWGDSGADGYEIYLKSSDREELISKLPEDQTQYTFEGANSSVSYHFVLASMDGENVAVREETVVAVPTDFVLTPETDSIPSNAGRILISKEMRLQRPTQLKANTLIVAGPLYTMGNSLQIETLKIISEGGLIGSFPEGSIAKTRGRPGGNILVLTERAEGTLHLWLSGESGGGGRPGQKGQDGTPGKNGRNIYCRAENGRVGYYITPDGKWDHGLTSAQIIINGRKGKPGSQGGVGGTGYPGGDTPQVLFSATNAENFDLDFSTPPGSGGSGGPGGPGGTGGLPGQPGEKSPNCPPELKPTPGRPGLSGPVGTPGPTGPAGKVRPYCFQLGDERIGRCNLFQPKEIP